MHKTFNIWGRDFNLEVMFGNLEDKDAKPIQIAAWEEFNIEIVNSCLKDVEEYCLKHNADEIGTSKIDNIFKYVIPESIYIKNTKDNSHVVALLCAYKFDEDNGMAIIFKNGSLYKIGTQNIV